MELDPRLQNISAADLQDFSVSHYPNFAPPYQNSVYGSGLNNDHAAQSHAQAYAQFVPDAHTGQPHFDTASTSPTQRRVSKAPGTRGSNVNNQGIHTPPTAARQARHGISQHQQPPSQYTNNIFTSPTSTTISSANQRHYASSTSSPHLHPAAHPHPLAHLHSTHQQPLNTVSQSQDAQQTPPDPSHFAHPSTFPLVPDPPNLHVWRERFFNIAEPLLLTSEEYHTYFPHVDNIYSHRSTQKYKKKLFVSHYWDCRLKGRPTGTPLSKLRKRKEAAEKGESLDEDREDHEKDGGDDGDDGGDGIGGKEVKKRKRKTRQRDLCDVKIKVTEFFGRDELEVLGKLNLGDDGMGDDGILGSTINGATTGNTAGASGGSNNGAGSSRMNPNANGQLTFVLEDGTSTVSVPSAASTSAAGSNGASRMSLSSTTGAGTALGVHAPDDSMTFGVLEPMRKFPDGHPGADGKRWYMVQRVNGSGKDGEDGSLDHKHTMEESDRIKKNSVQRWLLAQAKEMKKQNQRSKATVDTDTAGSTTGSVNGSSRNPSVPSTPSFHASGKAQQTAKSHAPPAASQLTFYGNSFCPFAQRVWIALELKGIPYQYVEVTPSVVKDGKVMIPSLLEVNPAGISPCIRHGNWGVWESDVILEYLEDLSMGHSLLPLGKPQLRAHCRLWKDHINRKVLPYFYALLLLPTADASQPDNLALKPSEHEQRSALINSLQRRITELVNASHAAGPFFLGAEISLVDIAFAPWIIRLSRVLEYYREFPKPEVGTRWKAWVDAVENNDAVRRTVSDEKSYHNIYGGVGKDGHSIFQASVQNRKFVEIRFAEQVVRQEGFGLGGDLWGRLPP